VVNTMVTSSGVLVLHNPFLLLKLHNMNIQTRGSSPPPSSHYLQAAQRLHLTTEQLSHLRLILQQYNRICRQQREDGLELVGLSAHSFSLQASLAAAADRPQVSTPTTTGCSTGQQGGTGSASGLTAAACGNNSDSQSTAAAAARQASQQAGCEDAAEQHEDDQQAVLEGLLQQHLHNRLDTLVVRYLAPIARVLDRQHMVDRCWRDIPMSPHPPNTRHVEMQGAMLYSSFQIASFGLGVRV